VRHVSQSGVCLLLQDLVQRCLHGGGGDMEGHVLRETTVRPRGRALLFFSLEDSKMDVLHESRRPGAVPPSEVEPASLTSEATTSTSVRINAHAIHAGEVAWRPALVAWRPALDWGRALEDHGSHVPRGGDQAREKPAGTLERALREACLYEPMMLVGGTCQTVTVELHRSMCIVLGDQAGTPAVLALSEGVGLAHQLTGIGPLQPEDIACGTQGAVKKDLQPCSIQWAPPPARPLTLHSVEKIDVCEGENGDPCPPNTRSEGKHESEQVEECNECAICLEPLQMGETIRLCCGHLFCLECTAQVCLSVCLPACLSVCLSVCLFVCLSSVMVACAHSQPTQGSSTYKPCAMAE
jgi:hypothetical protein